MARSFPQLPAQGCPLPSGAMNIRPVEQLETYGPERCDVLSVEQARRWCRRLALGRYENFSVLSSLVPDDCRDDFAAVYAFCRWADDLGDEVGDPARSLELLAWWRRELEQCYAGSPRHPVFIALWPTIERCNLPMALFDDLIAAFEQDQTVTRYETWEQLLGYCKRSADPVGRLVLMVLGEKRDDALFERSDAVCTALQLTNHWQDVKRDVLERGRIYVPAEFVTAAGVENFDDRLHRSAAQGWGVDQAFLDQSRCVLRECVKRTWPLFEHGEGLLNIVSDRARPVIWLFIAGGERVLHQIEMWNFETALHRPRLSKPAKVSLVAKAWLASRLAPRMLRVPDEAKAEKGAA